MAADDRCPGCGRQLLRSRRFTNRVQVGGIRIVRSIVWLLVAELLQAKLFLL